MVITIQTQPAGSRRPGPTFAVHGAVPLTDPLPRSLHGAVGARGKAAGAKALARYSRGRFSAEREQLSRLAQREDGSPAERERLRRHAARFANELAPWVSLGRRLASIEQLDGERAALLELTALLSGTQATAAVLAALAATDVPAPVAAALDG